MILNNKPQLIEDKENTTLPDLTTEEGKVVAWLLQSQEKGVTRRANAWGRWAEYHLRA